MAYGSSQARGRIGAVVATYTTDTATTDINPLSKARDRTHILLDAVRFITTEP